MRIALCPLIVAFFGVNAYCQQNSVAKQSAPIPQKGTIGESITYDVPEGLTTPEYLRFEQSSQLGPYCGPNSLYLLLKLKGILVNYEDLVKQIPVTPQGCSLAELRDVGESRGLTCEVRKLTLKELDLLQPPYILHINTPAEGAQQSTGARDHFVVVTRREPGGALVGVDPSSGNRSTWSKAYLSRNFSGYVLMSQQDPAKRSAGNLALGALFIFLTICNLILVRRTLRSRGKPL